MFLTLFSHLKFCFTSDSLKSLKCQHKSLCTHKNIHALYLYPLAFSYALEKYSSLLEE